MDLHNGITGSINSPALEVACSPPRIGAKKIQEYSESLGTTYPVGSVALGRYCHGSPNSYCQHK
jgi:hypothetical protein